MRILLASFFMVVIAASAATAAVTIIPLDANTKMLRVSYEIIDTDVGATGFTFPPQGFDFADGAVTLLTTFDLANMTQLDAQAISVDGSPYPNAIKVNYAAPLGIGQTARVRFTFDVPSNNFQVDTQGRWIVRYTTSHELRFVVPEGQQLVFSDTPVKIEESGGQVNAVYDAKGDDRRAVNFLFKTRPE